MVLYVGNHGSENFFCKGPKSKYVRFCGPNDFYFTFSILPLQHECSHKQYTDEWAWLCSSEMHLEKQTVTIFSMCTIVYQPLLQTHYSLYSLLIVLLSHFLSTSVSFLFLILILDLFNKSNTFSTNRILVFSFGNQTCPQLLSMGKERMFAGLVIYLFLSTEQRPS